MTHRGAVGSDARDGDGGAVEMGGGPRASPVEKNDLWVGGRCARERAVVVEGEGIG